MHWSSLGALMGSFYVTCLLFIFGALGVVARLHGFSIWQFVAYISDELLIVLGTSSSESVLPRMMAKLENVWVPANPWWDWSFRRATHSISTAPRST